MSNISNNDDSIAELKSWNPSQAYVIVCFSQPILGKYIVFEPNYRFTMYDSPDLLTTSREEYGPSYLYKINLPCKINPYLYFIFKNYECSIMSMLGNSDNDSCVKIVRRKLNSSPGVHWILKRLDKNKPTYTIDREGKLMINDKETDTQYCERLYTEWTALLYEPYYYQENTSPSAAMRIVYRNEQTEIELVELLADYCGSQQPCHDIYEFVNVMTSFFLSLFQIKDNITPVIDTVCLAYREFFETSSPKRIMNSIGPILENLSGDDRCHENFPIIHSIIEFEGIATKKSVFIGRNAEALYEVHFYYRHLSIACESQKSIDIPYKNVKFLYGFLLLSQ